MAGNEASIDGAVRKDACDARVTRQTSELLHDLIQSIVSALEARDPRTAEHSLRVGDMVERTCLLMGLPDEMTATIHMAAHVHDIGKIGIPDRVLVRNARLAPSEHELLRNHPKIGYDILAGCESLGGVAEIVLHHHERWDGAGYPGGLAGEDIPFGARVVAVCDSIDAMLSKRFSKKSMTRCECVQEIFLNSGSMYDPDIAWFVLKHWDEIVGPVRFGEAVEAEPGSYRELHCSVPAIKLLELIA